MSATGALRFGRYAFPPNRLGYCVPDDHQALLQYVAAKEFDAGLVELERRFSGAYPYLKLIAAANGIADPFDERVVDAYWIGNGCLEQVRPGAFYDSLEERFAPLMKGRDFGWLAGKIGMSARPHHNFHVFDVYTRAGLMKDEKAAITLETMDSCRISWAQVRGTSAGRLVVEREPLVLAAGKLKLGPSRELEVEAESAGLGFVAAAKPGDWVSVHWSWACEVLGPSALSRLRASTAHHLALANQTI